MSDRGDTFGEPGGAKRPGWPADPFRVRRALWTAKSWVIGAALLGVVFGLFWVKVVVGRTYESAVVLKHEGGLQIDGYDLSTGQELAPAAEALHRESVLRRIRELSGVDWSLPALASAIEYNFDPRGDTLAIRVRGDTPDGAADFANMVTDVFLAYHRANQARRIELEVESLSQRIAAAQVEAEEARQLYNEFRVRHGIAHLPSEQRSTVNSAAQLRVDSQFASAEARVLKARIQTLEEQLAKTPRTSMVAGGVSPEREAYNRLRSELASARASLSPDHPRVQSLEQQVEQLRSHVRAGGGGDSVVGSNSAYVELTNELRATKSELTTLLAKQSVLDSMAEKAQSRTDSLAGVEGEASTLLAEVAVNEALIGRLQATEAALEDALQHPPSGFSVLDPGSVPELPIQNKAKPVIFGAMSLVGLFCGLAFALWREFRGLRLQTPAEIAFWGSGPVLAATPWPSDPLGLDELVAGLDDLAPEAKGNLLLLGGTPDDASSAGELARCINADWFVDGPMAVAAAPAPSAPSPHQRGPLTTPPPPSGPYPVGGSPSPSAAPAQPSTALALRPVQLVRREQRIRLQAWDGPFEGQALRRAARLADRVIVLVRSDGMTALALSGIRRRIGRKDGIGYIVLALPEELGALPDRVGDVVQFWQT